MDRQIDIQRRSNTPNGLASCQHQQRVCATTTALAAKVATCGAFCVGPARDLTINIRDNSFFQLDPHVDPMDDGPDVFILGLESSVVVTFTPPCTNMSLGGAP